MPISSQISWESARGPLEHQLGEKAASVLKDHLPGSTLRLAKITPRDSQHPNPLSSGLQPRTPEPPTAPLCGLVPPHREEVGQLQTTFAGEQNVNWDPFACAIFIITAAIIHNEPLQQGFSAGAEPPTLAPAFPLKGCPSSHGIICIRATCCLSTLLLTSAQWAMGKSSTHVWEMLGGTGQNS